MVKVLGNFLPTELEAVLLGTPDQTVKNRNCFFFRTNIQIVISQSHQQSLLHTHKFFLQIGKVQRAKHSRDVQSLRNTYLLKPVIFTVADDSSFAYLFEVVENSLFGYNPLFGRKDVD